MAVYERSYKSYAGYLTPERTRFLVLPRYAYKNVMRSKLFVAFLMLCWLLPLALSLLIYLPHNSSFLKLVQASPADITAFFNYDATFFLLWFMVPVTFLAYLMALVMGPALISADLRNNALPLYLSRPFSRAEYVLGKTAVLMILLSAVTWIPGLWLFGLQAYLAGWAWFKENWFIGVSIFLASWIWILVLCLLSLAISAYVRWKPVARVAMFGIWFVLAPIGEVINQLFRTRWGSLLNLGDMIAVVYADLFRTSGIGRVPTWAAWTSLIAACLVFVWLLARKVRAYEVVRS